MRTTDGEGAFGLQRVISLVANGAISVFAADLDGDSDMDVLAALYSDNAIAWYENTDGKGTFGAPQVFTTQAGLASCVYGADLDGDGDVDVLSASTIDDKIAWYENADGKGTFGPQRLISAIADMASSVYAADVDGDGDMDVLSASIQDDKIAWYENTNGKGAFSPQKVITREADAPWSVFAADLDGDGDLDVLSASAGDDKIACYENIDSEGTFGPQQVITTKADGARSVYASDLDGDGDMDVLSASWKGDEIAWYRNREATLWDGLIEHLIDAGKGANSIDCGDFDGDGDADVMSAGTNEIAFYENLDFGSGSFLKHSIAGGASVICAADVDGDNALDVISGGSKEIAWWEYASADTFTKHLVDDQYFQSRSLYTLDLDSDGDMDVLAASSSKREIAWWENDGSENFAKKTISGNLPTIKSIYAIDMDRDGDVDMVSVESSTIAWWENDGLQNFSKHIVASKLNFAVYAVANDLDKDNDVDVIGVDEYGNQIILWENDGLQNFAKVVIDAEINWPTWVYVSDLDNDDDLDILAVSNSGDYVCLYENLGSNNFYKQIIRKNFDGANCVHAVDIDNDGDMDIVAGTSSTAHEVIWWENPLLVNPNLKTPDIAVLPDTLFFYIGTDQQINSIACSVKNIGSGILQVQNISSETNWIATIDTFNFFVKPGGEQLVTIKCSAAGLFNGVYKGVLVIRSNDPDTPIHHLPLILEMRTGLDVNFVNESEPNNAPAHAQKLLGPSPSGIKGTISVSDVGEIIIQDDDIEDLYVFTIQSSGIKLKLYDISADMDLILLKIVGNMTTIMGSNHRGSTAVEEYERANLEPGTYYVGVSIYDRYPIQDSSSYSLAVEGDIVTDVKKYENAMPKEFTLGQNYPNPFNNITTINFQVPKETRIKIKIYNTLGKEVRKLADTFYNVGDHSTKWDGLDDFGNPVGSGLYLYCMEAIDFNQVKKALFLK